MNTARKVLMTIMASVGLAGCTLGTGWSGKGVSDPRAALQDNDGLYIAVTEIDLTASEVDRGEFYSYTSLVEKSVGTYDGFMGFAKQFELLGDKAWTMTLWRDRDAMTMFMYGTEHRAAVEAFSDANLTGRFIGYTLSQGEPLPSFDDALNDPRGEIRFMGRR